MKLLNNLSLRVKILASFAISSGLAAIGITAFAIHLNTKTLETGIVSKARTIHSRLEAATEYVATQGGLKPAVDRLVGKYKDASELSDKEKLEVLQQVPIFSAMKIGAKDADKENYKFRVFSDEPRRKENLATPDELAIFKKFEADPQLKEWVANTGSSIIVYRPARLQEKQGCLVCHGHPSTSPWKNGKDILGYKMENWADQKLHGVFAIETNIAEAKAVASAGEWISTDKLIGTLVLSGTFLALIVTGFMVNGPLSALRGIAGRLDEASLQVEHSADSVSQSSQSISQASTEQSAAIVETSASTEEMSSMVNKNAENAARTSSLSSQSLKAAERGQTVVMQMLEAVKEISESSKRSQDLSAESNKEIESMVNLIQEISTKTRVINDIVFQTKLLSFNASVEAARAGEHGKGFAVVAEEVGNLAQMSGNASKEISTLLEDSVRRVTGIVQKNKETSSTQAEDINKRVDLGRKVAEECSQVLSEILGDAKKVADMAEEIAAASREQATGVTEITRAMSQLDQATQSNAAVSAESAKSANGLNQQASVLKRLVMTLRETLDGGQSASGYSPDHSAHSAPKHEAPTAVVLPMKKKKETAVAEKKATEGAPLKAAAGDGSLPSRNDQRFTDV